MQSRYETRTPRRVDGVDERLLPIGPEEAFVLSRIDGVASEAEIAESTGLDRNTLGQTLERLATLGVICFDASLPPRQRTQPVAAAQPGAHLTRPVIEALGADGSEAIHPAAALYDPSELDEPIDLDLPRKRRILDAFYRLDSLTHYELLAVQIDADKKTIKNAYFEIVSFFHPDRYFGKKLGSFKPKLEKVFSRITEAHDVLMRPESREEYDSYLATQQRNRDLERVLSDERARNAELDRARRAIEEQARIAERVTHSTPPPRPIELDARKRLLARKLGRSPSSPKAVDAAQIRERVAEDLKRRYEERLTAARAHQVRHYVEAADEALRANNPVSAANALRIAVSLAPEDKELVERLEQVQQQAAADMADSYIEQALYEERSGRFVEAARSYERALLGKPSPKLYERTAYCLLQSQGDLRLAGDYAKRAVIQTPGDAHYRVTLGRIFLAAGMKSSAQAEFERALQIAPDDDTIKDWLKRLKRGEA